MYIKNDISKLNIGSFSPKLVLLNNKIIFGVKMFFIKILSIIDTISAIDLFGNLGIHNYKYKNKINSQHHVLEILSY